MPFSVSKKPSIITSLLLLLFRQSTVHSLLFRRKQPRPRLADLVRSDAKVSIGLYLLAWWFDEEKKEEDPAPKLKAPNSPEKKKTKFEREGQESSMNSNSNNVSSKMAEKTPNMYSGLWTNGAKENLEFSDYTFKEHFGDVRMPTYLPRKYVLEYLLARVTKGCPNFFDKYFSFRTTVVNVKFLDGDDNNVNDKEDNESNSNSNSNKFRVHTKNETTGIEEIEYFDKCIWAGGINGIPNTPKYLLNLFKEGGFKGSLVHSSDTSNFKSDVENKRVLIVGGELSGEDLTLMAIKEGASQIYITCRFEEAVCNETSRWPYDKVKVHNCTTIVKVVGNTVTLKEVEKDCREQEYKVNEEGDKTILKDIDTVIFCTGYKPNLNMLDEALREPCDFCSPDCDGCDKCIVKMPDDWTMKKNEVSEAILGKNHKQIKPAEQVWMQDWFYNCYPELYRGSFWMKNTNMMYFLSEFSEAPLMETDIIAWMMASCVTGQTALPSREEMREENNRISLDSMQNLDYRFKMDPNFNEAINEAIGDWEDMTDETTELWEGIQFMCTEYNYRLLGKTMNECRYPVSYLCEDNKTLSDYGKKTLDISNEDSRQCLHEYKYDDVDDNNAVDGGEQQQEQRVLRPGWRTFRDHPGTNVFVSCFTGIESIPLPKPWFELDANDKLW